MAPSRKRLSIALAIVSLWLTGTAYAFWWFEAKDLRAFDPTGQLDSVLANKLANHWASHHSGNQALVISYWDPHCPCSQRSQSHISAIVKRYASQGVHFVIAIIPAPADDPTVLRKQARALFGPLPALQVVASTDAVPPASPAATVIDHQGRLRYLGPFSAGSLCNNRGDQFVEQSLEHLLNHRHQRQINTAVIGCYCPVDNTTTRTPSI